MSSQAPPPTEPVLESLARQPGGRELLSLGEGRDDLALVGGAVRDLLLKRSPKELDVVVASDAAEMAGEVAAAIAAGERQSPRITVHERFLTASVEWDRGRIDIARRRGESYPAPGSLPLVHPGTGEEDLRRRDFTVNAIAVPLGGPRAGELICPEHALGDLQAGLLRVLHERSFIDDPTRLLRLARYGARLGFQAERGTSLRAAEALRADALATVSRARVGAELRLALGEDEAVAALSALEDLGVLSALDRRLVFDPRLAVAALALLPGDGSPEELLMASMLIGCDGDREGMFELLDGLEFPAGDRERVIATALAAPMLAAEVDHADRPSELSRALRGHTPAAIALGVSLDGGDARAEVRVQRAGEWLARLRHVRLEINGEDLLAAGAASGPQIGRCLERALARKLDGEIAGGRESELREALEDLR